MLCGFGGDRPDRPDRLVSSGVISFDVSHFLTVSHIFSRVQGAKPFEGAGQTFQVGLEPEFVPNLDPEAMFPVWPKLLICAK